MNAQRIAWQDGAQFGDSETGELIAEYPELFDYECDFVGASMARLAFLTEFPAYRMETEKESFGE
jgi:hypothetical protein